VIEDVLAELSQASSDEAQQRLLVRYNLANLDEPDQALLRAAAIPHWFDGDFLAFLLDRKDAGDAFHRLLDLSFVERREDGRSRVQVQFRDTLLDMLWADRRGDFERMSLRAADYCARQDRRDLSWFREAVYHRFVAGIDSVVRYVQTNWSEWYSRGDFTKKVTAAILDAAQEHVRARRLSFNVGWLELCKMIFADNTALTFGGGGARCAYQAGVYQALAESGLEPRLIVSESVGAITAALIAGNDRDRRLSSLREFWNMVSSSLPGAELFPMLPWLKRLSATYVGAPGFFTPNPFPPFLYPPGSPSATHYYDLGPLRETLLRMVDFDLLNKGPVHFVVSAANVETGRVRYFDNRQQKISPEHILAACALPPAFPMVRIDGNFYWDANLVASTPMRFILQDVSSAPLLVFQVELYNGAQPIPETMEQVLARASSIRNDSRNRLVADYYENLGQTKLLLRQFVAKIPEDRLSDEDRELKSSLAEQPVAAFVRIRDAAADGTDNDPSNFERSAMIERWERGHADTLRLTRDTRLKDLFDESGVVVHDDSDTDPL
jgi:NTE family protein